MDKLKRFLGLLAGFIGVDFNLHFIEAYTMSLEATSAVGRIGAVLFGVIIQIILLVIFKLYFASSFFNGFVVAIGVFLIFDNVVFHWIFQLHRITNGSEANILEPLAVLIGILFLWYGLSKERYSELSKGKV